MAPGGRAALETGLGGLALLVVVTAIVAGMYKIELEKFRANAPGTLWVNWIGEFDCGPDVTIARPSTFEELKTIVRRHKSVRAAATGHSFNYFACPASKVGAVVDTTGFRRVKVVKRSDVESGYAVEAEAGVKMGQLQNEILAKGLTLRVPPGNPAYTLGGCIATGCHNLGQSHAQDLLSVKLVTHNGTVAEIRRGDPDFGAAAVSLGRLGIIISATLEVLPYRSLQWTAEPMTLPSTPEIIKVLEGMTARQVSRETVGNKLVFYLASQVMMMEHWIPTGRAGTLQESGTALAPYINRQPFRVGQGEWSHVHWFCRRLAFTMTPKSILTMLQIPAEAIFRGLHSSPSLSWLRKALGWQHSPEARGEASERPTGIQYTWAGWLDEVMNLIMGLRHIEVIFPLEPQAQAAKCLDVVFAHRHLAWWRLNVRTMQSEGFPLSSTYAPPGGKPLTFLRVDFVGPGDLIDMPDGEASLTAQLRKDCPGWRKHWGKGLFATSAEERWGDAEAFLEVANRWDPSGKFRPRENPTWLGGL